jgi:hypothetical protein
LQVVPELELERGLEPVRELVPELELELEPARELVLELELELEPVRHKLLPDHPLKPLPSPELI